MRDPCYSWDDPMRRPPFTGHHHGRPRWGRSQGSDAWAEFWSDWWRGPPPRPERGVVRYLILDAIRDQPRHGYEIIQAIGEKSHGAYRPSPGVVYPTLQMLEEMQLARAEARDERKAYSLTESGAAELKEGGPPLKTLVVVEFPSMAQARAWYASPEYGEALKLRRTALERRLIFVEGVSL
jgi:DNA-binding PadR family transcriptional regulator